MKSQNLINEYFEWNITYSIMWLLCIFINMQKYNSLSFYVPSCKKWIIDFNLDIYVDVCDRNQPVEVAVVSSQN